MSEECQCDICKSTKTVAKALVRQMAERGVIDRAAVDDPQGYDNWVTYNTAMEFAVWLVNSVVAARELDRANEARVAMKTGGGAN